MHQFKLDSSNYRIILLYGHVIAFNLMKIPFYSGWDVIDSKSVSIYSKHFLKATGKSCQVMYKHDILG